jgi:hypothetical protein
MAAPDRFILSDRFQHTAPDSVRAIAKRNGFDCRTAWRTARSEIWVKADPFGNGYWIVRMDTQGHPSSVHQSRPHYHKNWVANSDQLSGYLAAYDPTAIVYSDDGQLLGESAHSVHPEHLAKAQHIPR